MSGVKSIFKGYTDRTQTTISLVDTLSDWTATGTGGGLTVAESANHPYSGGQGSLLVTIPHGGATDITLTRADLDSLDFSEVRHFVMRTFCDRYDSSSGSFNGTIQLCLGQNASNYFYKNGAAAGAGAVDYHYHRGDFLTVGSPSWDSPITWLRLKIYHHATLDVEVYISVVRTADRSRPHAIFTFDDGYASWIDIAGYLEAAGLLGTFFTIPANITTIGATNFATMIAAGHEIGIHDSASWNAYSATEMEATATAAIAALEPYAGSGKVRTAGYPGGGYGQQSDLGNHTKVFAGLRAAGIEAARCSIVEPVWITEGLAEPLRINNTVNLNNGTSLAQALAAVETMKSQGSSCVFLCHAIGGSADATTWVESDFESLVNSVGADRLAGTLDNRTMSDWIYGMVHPGLRA